MYVSKQTKKNQHISFAEEVEKSDQEERTARGFSARKERRELRKRLKLKEQELLTKALEDLLTASVSNVLGAGETGSAYQFILSSFLEAMGSPADITDTRGRLLWFRSTSAYDGAEVFEDPDRKLAKGFLEAIYTNRDYQNTFTNALSLTSSEESGVRATVLSAASVDAIARPAGDIVAHHMRANIAQPFRSKTDDSKKRSQLECNKTVSEKVKKRKTDGQQAQEDGKEEGSKQEKAGQNDQE